MLMNSLRLIIISCSALLTRTNTILSQNQCIPPLPLTKEMKIFVGPFIHSIYKEEVTIVPNAATVINDDGKIEAIVEFSHESELEVIKKRFSLAEIIKLKEGQFLIPGLIDTHIHAPQFPNAGLGYDKTLLEWLINYTFPLESKYNDTTFARHVYEAVVDRTLRCGTTTAIYFGTIHCNSSVVLGEAAHCRGQRALVGKVNMDMNSPTELLEDTDISIQETERFIQDILAMKSDLVRPVVTPRFAYSCSAPLLSKLGKVAHKYNTHIQTHVSENRDEIEEVKQLFPNATDYTDVYDQAKLLTQKTILAHGVYLSESELGVIKERGASVAHCPNSNIQLQSGLCNVRRLLTAGVNVALGTDMAGGSNPSILDAIRHSLSTSISTSFSNKNYKPLSYHEAFYLATMGGAKALDMEDQLGNFVVGKFFDAIIVDTKSPGSPIQVFDELTLSELFQKFIYSGDDRNVQQVFVNGNLVVDKK